jgi:hypothetical protein
LRNQVPDTIQDIPYARNINLSGNVLHHLDGRFQVVLSLQRLHYCRNQLRVIEPSIVEAVTLQVVAQAPLLSVLSGTNLLISKWFTIDDT